MNNTVAIVGSFFAGIITVATIAVLVSNRSKTSDVIGAATKGMSNLINAAVSPVTGGSAMSH